MITYRGLDSHGVARTGRTDLSPDLVARTYFFAGWRRLTVTDDAGVEVAWVGYVDGHRAWSAETTHRLAIT